MPILGIIASSITGNLVTNSYESIATLSGTGSSGTISFTSIPSTYKHLQIRGIGASSGAGGVENPLIRFNSDTASNYSAHRLYGNGSSAAADAFTSQTWMRAGFVNDSSDTDILGALIVDVLDYTSTNKNKTMRVLSGVDRNGSGFVTLSSGLWFKTPEAITSISLILNGLNWTSDTTFALYGIRG
jgi:hypothetical protein